MCMRVALSSVVLLSCFSDKGIEFNHSVIHLLWCKHGYQGFS